MDLRRRFALFFFFLLDLIPHAQSIIVCQTPFFPKPNENFRGYSPFGDFVQSPRICFATALSICVDTRFSAVMLRYLRMIIVIQFLLARMIRMLRASIVSNYIVSNVNKHRAENNKLNVSLIRCAIKKNSNKGDSKKLEDS
ncbi:hypothetical protein PUN28_012826 [Cardiocondyla obscurior]|uniref:Uncharacterized protein n=1 Tax=Cardiocondyla obscurior TaxID=286306 RepID=A0AAW2F8B7_9HYME